MTDRSSSELCVCCTGNNFYKLPILPQTIISDGQLWAKQLARKVCEDCGATFHVKPLSGEDTNEMYNSFYTLGAEFSEADIRRVQLYQKWILNILSNLNVADPKAVLEIGGGNGLLAQEMQKHWEDADLYGVEPATQAANQAASLGVNVLEGTLDNVDLNHLSSKIDLIYSVNVMEHTLDPFVFLSQQKELLSDNGLIVAILPNGTKPNIETLFYDHITGFTDMSFCKIAERLGLSILHTEMAPEAIGDFQIVVFQKNAFNNTSAENNEFCIASIIKTKEEYMQKWQVLDRDLVEKSANKEVIIFGAGEMTSIIRAVTPEFWSKVQYLIVDGPQANEFHGKKVIDANDVEQSGQFVFIAVRPDFGQRLETRLSSCDYIVDGIHRYITA